MRGIFLDTETNGLNARRHTLLEIALKIVDVITGVELDAYETLIKPTQEEWSVSDAASLAVNGFTYEKCVDGISKAELKKRLLMLFEKWNLKRGEAVFICQNPSFDRAFFAQIVPYEEQEERLWPYHWLDLASMYWALALQKGRIDPKLFPWKTGFSKDRIASACHLPPEAKPHRAMNGVDHLILCYRALIGFPSAPSQ